MSPQTTLKTTGLLLIVFAAHVFISAQSIEDTKIEFLEIIAERDGRSVYLQFILTADQYTERIAMESSYDLVTWHTNDIYPNWDFDVEGQASYLSSPFGGSVFYRAGIVLPTIALAQDSVVVANGAQSQNIGFGVLDPAFPFNSIVVEAVSSNPSLIPQDNIQIRAGFGRSINVTPTFEGVGEVSIDIIATSPDGMQAKATLLVTVVEGGGMAPGFTELYDNILERKFPGLDHIFSTNSPVHRFSRMGEPGDWFYQPNTGEPDTAILGFTYDESENDFNVYTEIVRLTFLTNVSGNYEYVEVTNGVEQVVSNGAFNLDNFPFVGAGASPTEAAFARMAVGKNIINSAWTFDSATRFNYTEPGGSPEPGNWKYVKTGEKTGRVTLTYDEDNNNASVYREEVDLTFETLESGEFIYREYDGSALNNTFPGAFDFSSNP